MNVDSTAQPSTVKQLLHQHTARLTALMPHPGVPAGAITLSADGHLATLSVPSVRDLNAWYTALDGRAGVTVTSRSEERDGQRWGLGGLDWSVGLGRVPGLLGVWLQVTAVSAELEQLPDLPVVRAGFPFSSVRLAVAA